ncbi:MAG: class I adenylate-forming enzyme family protein [Acidobacteriota bacterium]
MTTLADIDDERGPLTVADPVGARASQPCELLAHLETVAASMPNRVALVSRGEGARASFGQLLDDIDRLAERVPCRAGEPVALATGNSLAFCTLFFALRRRGVPVVTLDAGLEPAAKAHTCRRLGIPLLLDSDGEIVLDAERGVIDSQRITVGGTADVRARRLAVDPVCPPSDIALIKLTSGSTGEPTGACFTAASLLAGIRQIGAGMKLDAGNVVLVVIPLSHSYGFDNGILSLAVLGTPLVLEPSIYPVAILRALRDSDADVLPVVPPLVRSLGQTAWAGVTALDKVMCAGGVLRPEAARAFHQASGRHVHNFYGSTETGGISFESSPGTAEACGTVGHPLPGVRIELGEDGRVEVYSAANLDGRFDDRGFHSADVDAGVATGDLGAWTGEGRLRLIGRSSDLLNIGGRRIATATVEKALLALDGVSEAAVVGIDDEVRGQRTVAFLVADHWPVSVRGLLPHVAPREVRRIQALPFTERGKLDRARLRYLASRERS